MSVVDRVYLHTLTLPGSRKDGSPKGLTPTRWIATGKSDACKMRPITLDPQRRAVVDQSPSQLMTIIQEHHSRVSVTACSHYSAA
jgi:hypothetical protein